MAVRGYGGTVSYRRIAMVSPYQPFSGIDRAMASWHGIEGRKPDFAKTQGQKIRFALKPIWVRALRLMLSQVYITRPCLPF